MSAVQCDRMTAMTWRACVTCMRSVSMMMIYGAILVAATVVLKETVNSALALVSNSPLLVLVRVCIDCTLCILRR